MFTSVDANQQAVLQKVARRVESQRRIEGTTNSAAAAKSTNNCFARHVRVFEVNSFAANVARAESLRSDKRNILRDRTDKTGGCGAAVRPNKMEARRRWCPPRFSGVRRECL